MQNKFEFQAEIKAIDDGTGIFEGFGSVFNNVDSYGDVVVRGAFSQSLKNKMPALLWQHDPREPIGKWLEARETDEGLYMKGQLFVDDIPRARQAYKLLKEQAMRGLSIGFRTMEEDFDSKKGVRTIKKVDLLEVSVVTFPANDKANVMAVKKALPETEREFEEFLREFGFSRTAAKAITAHGIKGYQSVLREAGVTDTPCVVLRDADELNKSLKQLENLIRGMKHGSTGAEKHC